MLEWAAMLSSRGSSQPRDGIQVPYVFCIGRPILYHWRSLLLFSNSAMSNSLQPHGLQHARLFVHHQLLELAKTHVHQVGDAIQPSHLLSSPSLPAFNLSQHQVGRIFPGSFPMSQFFKWHQVTKVLERQLQHQSLQ